MKTVVLALKAEAETLIARQNALFIEKIGPQGRLWECKLGHILITGVGVQNVWQTMRLYLQHYQPLHILNIGSAGNIGLSFQTLQWVKPQRIIDVGSGYYFCQKTENSECVADLLTVPSPVVSSTDRSDLRSRFGNVMVDMEAACLLYCASAHQISWTVWKCLTDNADQQTRRLFKSRLKELSQLIAEKVEDLWKDSDSQS